MATPQSGRSTRDGLLSGRTASTQSLKSPSDAANLEASIASVLATADRERGLRLRVQQALEETVERQETLTKALENAEAKIQVYPKHTVTILYELTHFPRQELTLERAMAERFHSARLEQLKASFVAQLKERDGRREQHEKEVREELGERQRKERDRDRERVRELRLGLEDEMTNVSGLEEEVSKLRDRNGILSEEVKRLTTEKRVWEHDRARLRSDNILLLKTLMEEKKELERLLQK